MTDYIFRLMKGSRKEVCPRCRQRSFTPYVDAEGRPVGPTCGRCDHQNRCGYHQPPREFFNLNPEERGNHRRLNLPRATPEAAEPSQIPHGEVAKTTSAARYPYNKLIQYLTSVFDDEEGRRAVNAVCEEYAVGTVGAFGGSPVFWQVDGAGRVRSGKVMGYNPSTGKRIKEPRPQIAWAHRLLAKNADGSPNLLYQDYNLIQCFYGSHIAARARFRHLPLWVFESEKAALICAISLMLTGGWEEGHRISIPIATGSVENLKVTPDIECNPYHRMRALRGRDVVLWPDEGQFETWLAQGVGLSDFAKSVSISVLMEGGGGGGVPSLGFQTAKGEALDDVLLRSARERGGLGAAMEVARQSIIGIF